MTNDLTVIEESALVLPEDMSRAEWVEAGKRLVAAEKSLQWALGKWWLYGIERKYGDGRALAEEVGVDYGTIRNCASVVLKCHDRRDNLSFGHHQAVAALPAPKQTEMLDRAEAGKMGVRDLRVEVMRDKLAHRHVKAAASLGFEGRFQLIYADPPWTFELASDLGRSKTADVHYPCMSYDEIENLQIDGKHIFEMIDRDAALFMWCTSSNFELALKVVKAWGFEYKTNLTWDKVRVGTGYIFLNQHEHLLYCTHGKMPAPLVRPPSMFRKVRGKHSEKPVEVRKLLEKMYPDFTRLNRIELFARGKVPGWQVWGNEAVNDLPLTNGKTLSNVAPVDPKLAKSVETLLLEQEIRKAKRLNLGNALAWRAAHPGYVPIAKRGK